MVWSVVWVSRPCVWFGGDAAWGRGLDRMNVCPYAKGWLLRRRSELINVSAKLLMYFTDSFIIFAHELHKWRRHFIYFVNSHLRNSKFCEKSRKQGRRAGICTGNRHGRWYPILIVYNTLRQINVSSNHLEIGIGIRILLNTIFQDWWCIAFYPFAIDDISIARNNIFSDIVDNPCFLIFIPLPFAILSR